MATFLIWQVAEERERWKAVRTAVDEVNEARQLDAAQRARAAQVCATWTAPRLNRAAAQLL